MKILTNIRTKVWSCVSVALLAYLVATITASLANMRITESLTVLEAIHFPLALKGEKVYTIFTEQTKNFENGLLTGELAELDKAKQHHVELIALLNEMVHTAASRDLNFYTQLLTLRDAYEDYFNLAAEQYLLMSHSTDPFAETQQMLRLGKLREELEAEFEKMTGQLSATVINEIKNNKQRTSSSSRLLYTLFVAVLLVITLFINLLANRQLITPLKKLREMIDGFARGKPIEKPQICNKGDEICSLALSFWNMTEELKKISVSKDYLDNIINYMSDSLLVLSPTLIITRVNQSTLNLLSYQEEDLLHQPARRIFSEYGAMATIQTIFEELLQGKSITNLEIMLRTSDNRHIPVLFSGTTFYTASGKAEGIICLARDIRELKEDLKNKENLANYDTLTHLPNRNLLQDRLSHGQTMARGSGRPMALLLLDVDHFSTIIETRGQAAANLILQETAKRFLQSVRETDTVARMKRDQFAIVLTNLNDRQDAELVAGKIIKEISLPFSAAGPERIGISIGIAFFPDDGNDGSTLLRHADRAMHEAKKQGGNRYVFYHTIPSAPPV
jgi:diguanylate cyclase (GGDEF)-like protein/PAS domain S-box-containing protein